MIMHTDRFHTEEFLPDSGDEPFQTRTRRGKNGSFGQCLRPGGGSEARSILPFVVSARHSEKQSLPEPCIPAGGSSAGCGFRPGWERLVRDQIRD
jgi:hypothetical protein